MRGTPRTDVPMTVPQLRDTWVVFKVAGTELPLEPDERVECEEFWQSLELAGAVMVVDLLSTIGEKAAKCLSPIECHDWRLRVNVSHRIRDGFLHTRFPLLHQLDGNPHSWATDDPRLVQIVRKETEQ